MNLDGLEAFTKIAGLGFESLGWNATADVAGAPKEY
jgi:hypothetical protein